MNTLFLTGSLSRDGGGVFTALQGLVPALAGRGVHVSLHGLRDAGWAQDGPGWEASDVVAHPVIGPASFGWSPAMRRAASHTPADLVHCHGLWRYPSLLARRIQRRRKIPLVVSPHGMLNEQALAVASTKKRLALAAYERDVLMNAQCLHALVDTEREAIRRFGFRGPVCVIPNGVNGVNDMAGAPARPAVQAPWREQSLPIPEHAPVLLYLGRKHPIKNLDGLLDAWGELERAGANGPWHLVVAGWGEPGDEAALQARFRRAGLSTAHCLGPQFGADKAAALSGAQGFVLVSHGEALPVAVLEAWAYGLPAVLSPQCNFPQAYELGAALAAPLEPAELVQALRRFVSLPAAERHAMGARGRAFVQAHYTWAGVAEKFQAVYRWLGRNDARPDCVEPALP